MKKRLATENSLRKFLRESMSGTGVGWPHSVDTSEKPISTNAVVDPSAAAVDPSNEKFKPRNRMELSVSLPILVDDIADMDAPDAYTAIKDALKDFATQDEDKEMSKKEMDQFEEAIRRSIRKTLVEKYGRLDEAQVWKVTHSEPDESTSKKRREGGPSVPVTKVFANKSLADMYYNSVKSKYPDATPPFQGELQDVPSMATDVQKVTASTSPKREKAIAALRQHLEKSSVDAEVEAVKSKIMSSASDDPVVEEIKDEPDALESLAYAIKEIDDAVAIRYAKCFNEAKEELLLFEEEAELDVDEPEETPEATGEEGGQFELAGEEVDEKKIAKLSADYALFEKYGDRSIMSTKTFKELWGGDFDSFIYDIGNTVKKAMASRMDDKRTYLKDKLMTAKEISDVMGFSQALVNRIMHQSLGKYALGIKAAVAGYPLKVDAEVIPSAETSVAVQESQKQKPQFLTLKERYALKNKNNK